MFVTFTVHCMYLNVLINLNNCNLNQDGFIDAKEFERLIDLLHYYNELYKIFKQLDKNSDKRISFAEFKKGHELVGLHGLSNAELKEEFNEIDTNQGEFILFDEVK